MSERRPIGKRVAKVSKKIEKDKDKTDIAKDGLSDILHDISKSEEKAFDVTPQIAMRAYQLYEQRGRQEGLSVQDWEQAEREIRID
jgi:hypothetical protein